MRPIQFIVYFNHHLHMFMLSYITYIVWCTLVWSELVLQFQHSEVRTRTLAYLENCLIHVLLPNDTTE